jgi:hypothetical protein
MREWKMNQSNENELQVMQVLESFQLLEFSLKSYISAAYLLIKESIKEPVYFDYGYKDIEGFPLERLLGIFKKINRNLTLHEKLNRLPAKRNEIAHRALLYRHEVIREILKLDIDAHAVNLSEIEKEIDWCLLELANDLSPLMARINKD